MNFWYISMNFTRGRESHYCLCVQSWGLSSKGEQEWSFLWLPSRHPQLLPASSLSPLLLLPTLQISELLRSPIWSYEAAASHRSSNTQGPADLPAELCSITTKDYLDFNVYLKFQVMEIPYFVPNFVLGYQHFAANTENLCRKLVEAW